MLRLEEQGVTLNDDLIKLKKKGILMSSKWEGGGGWSTEATSSLGFVHVTGGNVSYTYYFI